MQNNIFKPLYYLDHSPINVHFSKNQNDFVVREIPLYDFSGDGEHLILNIEKKGLSTQEALKILSSHSGAKIRDFGYAGLKDKQGLTSQFISIPKKFSKEMQNFECENIKILSENLHNNKLRIGHLKGNHFFIKLKKVNKNDAQKIINILEIINKNGFANYFGYQRFGKFKDNANNGLEILRNNQKSRSRANPKINNFLISAFQSELFNKWLSNRIKFSKFINDFSINELSEIYNFISKDDIKNIKEQVSFFKILKGDVMAHYPFGKCFLCEDLNNELERFINRNITCCGLMLGDKSLQSNNLAKMFENEIFENFNDIAKNLNGSRRFAWTYLENLKYSYNEEKAQFSLSFDLQKGSYATVLLEEILHKDLFEQ